MHFLPFSELSLMELAAQGDSYALKREQIMTGREIEDTERYIRREEEDEKYDIILTNS
jgi:hypothetical protein